MLHCRMASMDTTAIADIRAQRAEVEALLSYTHAKDEHAKALAWWRLHRARQARLAAADAQRPLPPLPAPPAGALKPWQHWAWRRGWLRLERAAPPRPLARALQG
jgi:hypothetical protein